MQKKIQKFKIYKKKEKNKVEGPFFTTKQHFTYKYK